MGFIKRAFGFSLGFFSIYEACPGVLGNREETTFISLEQVNKHSIEEREHDKYFFDFGARGNNSIYLISI